MEKERVTIIQYEGKFKNQIITLIAECLVDQDIRKASCLPVNDEDLHSISEVYKGRGKFWVAFTGGKVVGTVAIKECGATLAKLKRLFVQQTYRGTGLGQQLLDTALQFAKEAKYTKVILNTHKNMIRAQNFYKKNHFTFMGSKSENMLSFEKDL